MRSSSSPSPRPSAPSPTPPVVPPSVRHNAVLSPAQASLSTPSQQGGCPECGSPYYKEGSSQTVDRCFACGYAKGRDFGVAAGASPVTEGNVIPTHQIPTEYTPNQVIGKIE